jgi:hypothetical protein
LEACARLFYIDFTAAQSSRASSISGPKTQLLISHN